MLFKRILFYFIIGSICLFIQLSIFTNNFLAIKNVMPDIMLVLIILLFQICDDFEMLIFAFVTGFVIDVYSGNLAGLNAFFYCIVVALLYNFKNYLNIKTLPFYLFLVLLSLLIKLFIYYLFGYIFKEVFVIYKSTLLSYAIHILYTLFWVPFLSMIIYIKPIIELNSKKMYGK